jgi:hypothetical protein
MIIAGLSSRSVTFGGFAIIALVAVVWELAGVLRAPNMTIGRVVRWAMRARTARLLFLAFWIWVGWHLFARGSGAFKKDG